MDLQLPEASELQRKGDRMALERRVPDKAREVCRRYIPNKVKTWEQAEYLWERYNLLQVAMKFYRASAVTLYARLASHSVDGFPVNRLL